MLGCWGVRAMGFRVGFLVFAFTVLGFYGVLRLSVQGFRFLGSSGVRAASPLGVIGESGWGSGGRGLNHGGDA